MRKFTINDIDDDLRFIIRHVILSYFVEHQDGDYIETNLNMELIKQVSQTDDTAFLNNIIRFMTTEQEVKAYVHRISEPMGREGKAIYYDHKVLMNTPLFMLQRKSIVQ